MSMLTTLLPLLIVVAALLLVGATGLVSARSTDPVRHVRGRLRLALGVFGAVLVLSWAWGTVAPELLGLPIVVGPGAAAAVGMLVFAVLPAHAASTGDGVRAASLRPRTALQVVDGRMLVAPAVLLVALVALLVATGLTADAAGDSAGRAFSVERSAVGASGGPYPGWFYGTPVLVTAALLVLALALAIRRTVLLPAVAADHEVDAAWRSAVGRTLCAIATAALLLYLAGVLWATQVVWRVLAQVGTPGPAVVVTAHALAVLGTALAAVVVLLVATIRVAAVGRTIAKRPVAA